jgi:hypothetical protein
LLRALSTAAVGIARDRRRSAVVDIVRIMIRSDAIRMFLVAEKVVLRFILVPPS